MPTGNPTALIPQSIVTIQPYKFPCFAKHQKCFSSVVVQQARQRHRGCARAGMLGSASKEKTKKHIEVILEEAAEVTARATSSSS